MWYHIAKANNKLYQDGKEVEKLNISGSIGDVVIKGIDNLWIKII